MSSQFAHRKFKKACSDTKSKVLLENKCQLITLTEKDFAYRGVEVWVIVFNATFNNISAISLRSVLLVEETDVPGENHQPVISHCKTLSHNIVSSTPHQEWGLNSQH